MKPKSIGIIGGAGPIAGAFLLERILTISNKKYECYKDSDFPNIFLISFPFSEMLSPIIDAEKIRNELRTCLAQLRNNGASVLAIACNTLHAFLDTQDELNDLVHLPRVLAKELSPEEIPLVLCTSTSTQFGLHKRFFPCTYPGIQTQREVDEVIDQILRGIDRKIVLKRLKKLLQAQSEKTVILGCTELSLFTNSLCLTDKLIIDPLEMVAQQVLKIAFKN